MAGTNSVECIKVVDACPGRSKLRLQEHGGFEGASRINLDLRDSDF
jgi:hypothetical protein